MKYLNKMLGILLLGCISTLIVLSGCRELEETAKQTEPHVETKLLTEWTSKIHQELNLITEAARKYKEEQGEDPLNDRVLKDYLEVWPEPPEQVRDPGFNFEWNYFITGTLDDMGGPTSAPDTVVFLEGVNKEVCYSFNRTYGSLGDGVWDFLGKNERPDVESWCENGGNPYRIIHVVSLR